MSTTSEIIRIVNRIIGQAKKIVDLPSAPSVAGTDLIEVSIGGVSYKATASQVGSGGSGVVQTIVAGAGINVDATDPANPIVAATGGGGTQDLQSVLDQGSTAVLTAGITITGAFDVILGDGGSKLNSFSVLASSGFNVQSNNGTASAYVIGNSTGLDLRWQNGLGLDGHLLMNPSGNFFSGSSAFTFTPTATVSGFNFGSVAADPSTLNNADAWYDNVLHLIRARVNGASVSLLTSATGLSNSLASARILVGNGSNVATAVDMSGQATIDNAGAVTLSNAAVIAKVLTGFTSGAGTVAATDTILQAIQKLDGNDALNWKLTGTSTLTGNVTIANGGFTLAFSGAGTHSFSSTSATVAGNFTATSTYTVPAGGAVSAYGSVFNGTITGKGTANDLLCMVRVNGALNNSTGSGVTHVSLRVDTTHGGSVNPSASIAIQAIAGHSMSTAEIFRGVNSSGQTRYQMFADGHHVWTQTVTGSDFGGSMSTNAANGAGHLAMSFQLSGSATTAHTHFGVKATGGMTTNATNATYNSFWDARSLVVNHTGFTGYGFRYAPVVTGTQSGTETLYAFIAESGLSGFGIATPTARLQTRGVNNAVAFLAEDDAGNSIASFGESGGARVIGFFGATPVVQQTMGAATAGAAYTATEQTMLQAVYDAVRNIGIGT